VYVVDRDGALVVYVCTFVFNESSTVSTSGTARLAPTACRIALFGRPN
jgi:hypothetical protein